MELAASPESRATLDLVEDVRIAGDWEREPLRFRILFLVAEDAEDAAPLAIAPLVAKLTDALDSRIAVLAEWAARSRRQVSLADAEATEPLFLEDLTLSETVPQPPTEDN